MSADSTPPLHCRAARERRLSRMLRVLFFLAGQMGLAAWLCTWAGAPEWVHAVLMGVLILGLVATVRVLMVYLGLLAARAQENPASAPTAAIDLEKSP